MPATTDTILSRLVQMLADDFQVDPTTVTRTSHLRTDLGLDSLSLTDLAFLVQQDFGFKATPESFRGITNVGQLVDFVAVQTGAAAAPETAP